MQIQRVELKFSFKSNKEDHALYEGSYSNNRSEFNSFIEIQIKKIMKYLRFNNYIIRIGEVAKVAKLKKKKQRQEEKI